MMMNINVVSIGESGLIRPAFIFQGLEPLCIIVQRCTVNVFEKQNCNESNIILEEQCSSVQDPLTIIKEIKANLSGFPHQKLIDSLSKNPDYFILKWFTT